MDLDQIFELDMVLFQFLLVFHLVTLRDNFIVQAGVVLQIPDDVFQRLFIVHEVPQSVDGHCGGRVPLVLLGGALEHVRVDRAGFLLVKVLVVD